MLHTEEFVRVPVRMWCESGSFRSKLVEGDSLRVVSRETLCSESFGRRLLLRRAPPMQARDVP